MSEKVDDLLSKSPEIRHSMGYLDTLRFTNTELCEIFEKSKRKINSGFFHANLIKSQDGPFTPKVFSKFKTTIDNNYEAWMSLFKKSKGLNPATKKIWLKKAIEISAVSMEFIMSDRMKKDYDVDINKKPYNTVVLSALMKFTKSKIGITPAVQKYKEYVCDTFDSLTHDAQVKVFYNTIGRDEDKLNANIPVLSLCKNINPDLIQLMMMRTDDNRRMTMLAKNNNCPTKTKLEVYDKTGDEDLLPDRIANIFVF